MDIRSAVGDITTVEHGVIVHGVNCQGKMNSGVAKTIREKWPLVYEHYRQACESNKGWPTDLLGTVQPVKLDSQLIVANGFTQDKYGYDGGRYAHPEAIGSVLRQLAHSVSYSDCLPEYRRIHMPKIGGTRGGLDFDKEVMPVIEKVAAAYPEVTFIIWTYDGTVNA